MRKLMVCAHISLDGCIQSTDDGDGFPYADWTAPYRTAAGRERLQARFGSAYDLLLGRRTYDQWSGFWPHAPASPMGDALNAATKFVVTHRPESLRWGPFEALGPDFLEALPAIKAGCGRDLIVWGSSTLTSALIAHGLADELLLLVYPVLLGAGKRLFAEGTPARAFTLTDAETTATGVAIHHYRLGQALRKS